MLDLRWDDPTNLAKNAAYNIVGVNIYRSDASDRGPFRRINEFPIGGNFFRDRTNYARIERESIRWNADWVFKGDAPNDRRWVLKTRQTIAKRFDSAPHQTPTWANSPADVTVYIDGEEWPAGEVFGRTGEVTLVNTGFYDLATESGTPFSPPTDTSVVEVTYYTPKNHVKSGLEHNIWYRIASVAVDASTPSGYAESPLDWCEPRSVVEVEALDYIWREAMRRNAWILGCGGERILYFIRKTAGVPCDCCIDDKTLEYSKQPSNRCLACFGVGFIGGYEGPYEGIIVPDDAERRISQAVGGRRKEHTYEVWTGPSPLLTQRDFVVKQTNERYSIGPVRRPSHRGNLMQQHFTIAYFDQGDVRYKVPVDGTSDLPWPETRGISYPPGFGPQPVDHALEGNAPWPVGPNTIHPQLTEKSNIPDERERRGRTKVWENTEYGILWWLPVAAALTGVGHALSGIV